MPSVTPDLIRQSAITQDHLQDWLARIPARKSLVLLDTCESGSFARTGLEWMMQKTAIAKLSQAMGRVTIVAALDNQAALEGYKGHGVFTYVLLQALREADVRFGNRDGYTGLFELVQYVLDGVPKISLKAFGYKQDALYSAPYYWAGFIYTGA